MSTRGCSGTGYPANESMGDPAKESVRQPSHRHVQWGCLIDAAVLSWALEQEFLKI